VNPSQISRYALVNGLWNAYVSFSYSNFSKPKSFLEVLQHEQFSRYALADKTPLKSAKKTAGL
jgi:hypothetical protein